MGEWTFKELREVPKTSTLLIGMPDVGLVGLIASTYLVKKLKAEMVGYLDSRYLPPVILYHEAKPLPVARFHYHTSDDTSFLILVSEVAVSPTGLHALARELVEWAISKGVERIIMLGGVPTPQRMKLEKPRVYGACVVRKDVEEVEKAGVNLFKEGFISGPYALLIKECYSRSLRGIALLAEAFLNYPDPGAAAALLGTLHPLLGVEVDVKPLLEQAEEIRIKLRETMKRTLETMRESGKAYEYTIPAMYL